MIKDNKNKKLLAAGKKMLAAGVVASLLINANPAAAGPVAPYERVKLSQEAIDYWNATDGIAGGAEIDLDSCDSRNLDRKPNILQNWIEGRETEISQRVGADNRKQRQFDECAKSLIYSQDLLNIPNERLRLMGEINQRYKTQLNHMVPSPLSQILEIEYNNMVNNNR